MSLSEREIRKLQDLLQRNADLDNISVEREILAELVNHYVSHPPAPQETPPSRTTRFVSEGIEKRGKKKTDD